MATPRIESHYHPMVKVDVVSRWALMALPMMVCVSCVRVTSSGHSRDAAPDQSELGDSGIDGTVDSGDRSVLTREVIGTFVETVASTFAETEVRLLALQSELTTWQSDPNNAVAQTSAQMAWQRVMATWQQAELYRLGPAGAVPAHGGVDLRSDIYAWPLVTGCRIDEETVALSYQSADTLASKAVNVRGLASLEYVLFVSGTGNACRETSPINMDGSWTALGEAEVRIRRAAYALAIANLLVAKISQLRTDWQVFGADLMQAGNGSARFTTTQQALNAMSDALFHLPDTIKDLKLGRPLGVFECPAADCRDASESTWALASREHLAANIEGFRQGFYGPSDAPGFDDLLSSVGQGEVAFRIEAELRGAEEDLALLTSPIQTAVAEQRAVVEAVHQHLRNINMIYRAEVISILDLELPQGAEGDND